MAKKYKPRVAKLNVHHQADHSISLSIIGKAEAKVLSVYYHIFIFIYLSHKCYHVFVFHLFIICKYYLVRVLNIGSGTSNKLKPLFKYYTPTL